MLNSSDRKIIPNLFIPGAPKSGTSSLHEYLNLHPMIQMSKIKEPHLYALDEHYKTRFNSDSERGFSKLFEYNEDVKFFGESSTTYCIDKKVLKRIKDDIANPKFIFIFRDPIERALSHYNWLTSLGIVINESFWEEFITSEKDNFDANQREFGSVYKTYYWSSKYKNIIENFLEYFDEKSILILTTEELKNNKIATLNKCFKFLGVSNLYNIPDFETNKTKPIRIRKEPSFYKIVKKFFSNNFKDKLKKRLNLNSVIEEKLSIEKPKYIISDAEKERLIQIFNEDMNYLKDNFNVKTSDWKNFKMN
ncbi:hypothetical protein EI427_06535 [Flammeovirga pectinis]|uniref:Sulfotransferase domain-containing protein n=1 Tax=Flammeovirga pectinis TaxID=2494373 RepID=A0A3S9P137_9BACT|nr:sulfotransferase domain-containing protein [Flammeovirga pectinis]AZQ61907.1 hypothetical protein EI427_06535 [Flammeovirga pectinis]